MKPSKLVLFMYHILINSTFAEQLESNMVSAFRGFTL